jgi:hypothetical protein
MSLTLGSRDYHVPGGHKAVCDVCGFVYHGQELRKRWDGLMVCPADFEQRHPQDLIRGIIDRQTPPFIRDRPALTFVEDI